MYLTERAQRHDVCVYVCQAHDRILLSSLRLSGPLWASLGLSGPQPASQPPSQPAKRMIGFLVVIPPASQPASQLAPQLDWEAEQYVREKHCGHPLPRTSLALSLVPLRKTIPYVVHAQNVESGSPRCHDQPAVFSSSAEKNACVSSHSNSPGVRFGSAQ